MSKRFKNREMAGKELASRLTALKENTDVIILALPRGGVPVGYEIAKSLKAPLDVEVVRKLGVPGHKELAFGALGSGGVVVFNESIVHGLELDEAGIRGVIRDEEAELERRAGTYRHGDEPAEVAGKIAVLVDDGLATGATMRAAIASVRKRSPAAIVVAVPVAAAEICVEFDEEPDVTCLALTTPERLYGVGWWYENFEQTTDREVCRMLDEIASGPAKNPTRSV